LLRLICNGMACTQQRGVEWELSPCTSENGGELAHTPADPLVDLVEHVLVLIDGIADRSRLTQSRV
jgi:hypothetical protein